MAKAAPQLTLEEIVKLDKELNKTKKIKLLNKYPVEINLHFRDTKIKLLIAEYLQFLSELRNRKDITAETVLNSVVFLNTLVVKHFSTVPIPLEINDIDSLITLSNTLYDLGILPELFGDGESAFPKEELDKLSIEMEKSQKAIGSEYGEMMIKQAFNEVGVVDGSIQ